MARLINSETKEQINIGDKVTTFRGNEYLLSDFVEPHKPSSTGRVYVKNLDGSRLIGGEYFPSVIGAEIIEHQFS